MKTVIIISLILVIFGMLLVACAPIETKTEKNTETNMTFVGRVDEIQVWKFYDGTDVCYVTVNANRYTAAGIFCK